MLKLVANVELVLCALVVCAVSLAIPPDYFNWLGSLGFVGSDLAIFLSAVIAYWMLMSQRDPSTWRVSGKSKKDVCVEEEDTLEQVSAPLIAEEAATSCPEAPASLIVGEANTARPVEILPVAPASLIVEEAATASPDEILPEALAHKQEIDKRVAMLEKHAYNRNIKEALHTFRSIELSGETLTSSMYNAVLKAWIKCGNLFAAENWLEEVKSAGMADETSFSMLIKVHAKFHIFEKCPALMQDMIEVGIQPGIASYNELLHARAKEGNLAEGISLMEEIYAEGIQPNNLTLNIFSKLLNCARNTSQSFNRIRLLAHKYDRELLLLACLPRLTAVVLKSEQASNASYTHEVCIIGSLPRVRAARRSLKQDGFFDDDHNPAWPMDGHYETEHGLIVFIEGKMVRWSRQRASKLRFIGTDRRACLLSIYGEPSQGKLLFPALVPGATKTLQWDNGDVWHAYEGRTLGPITFSSQTMSKTSRDAAQDVSCRARSDAILRCVSKQGLRLPSHLEDSLKLFLGGNLHHFQVCFESKWIPSRMNPRETKADVWASISCSHPRVGFRHCWAEGNTRRCGQRTFVNGEEVNEDCFNRHIGAVYMA